MEDMIKHVREIIETAETEVEMFNRLRGAAMDWQGMFPDSSTQIDCRSLCKIDDYVFVDAGAIGVRLSIVDSNIRCQLGYYDESGCLINHWGNVIIPNVDYLRNLLMFF